MYLFCLVHKIYLKRYAYVTFDCVYVCIARRCARWQRATHVSRVPGTERIPPG